MAGILNLLHAFAIALALAGLCLGSGAVLARWLGLGAGFIAPVGFGATALAGLVAFCAWWVSPSFGTVVSLFLSLGGIALLCLQLADPAARSSVRAGMPSLLAALAIGGSWLFLVHAAGVPASVRFTHQLPIDDQLPRMFAERIAAHQFDGPIVANWLASDRPPLQAGVLLLMRPLTGAGGLPVEVAAILCQMMWLPALAAVGCAAGFPRRSIALGIFFAATSGFFLVNSVYTWPKLMGGSLFVSAIAVVLGAIGRSGTGAVRIAVTTGVLLALSILAHGGLWFSLLALPALPIAWRALRWFGAKGILAVLLAFAAVNAPWFVYQSQVDPPGNRLVKWHLAGVTEPDERSSVEALRDEYSRLSAAEILRTRVANLSMVTRLPGRDPGEDWGDQLRRIQFFHFTPTVGLPLVGALWLIVLALRRPRAPATATALVVYSLATVTVWIGLLFIPGGAAVHQGSYVPVMLLISVGGAAMGGWPLALRIPFLVAHVSVFLAAWILTTPSHAEASFSPALLAGGALLFLLGIAMLPRVSEPEPAQHG